jgi:hypothetical protein
VNSDRLLQQELHLRTVQEERSHYTGMVDEVKATCQGHQLNDFVRSVPCSRQGKMIYSFIYLQEMYLLSDPFTLVPFTFSSPESVVSLWSALRGSLCRWISSFVVSCMEGGYWTPSVHYAQFSGGRTHTIHPRLMLWVSQVGNKTPCGVIIVRVWICHLWECLCQYCSAGRPRRQDIVGGSGKVASPCESFLSHIPWH